MFQGNLPAIFNGIQYQLAILLQIILQLRKLRLKNYYVATEKEHAGKHDDVYANYALNGKTKEVHIQVKLSAAKKIEAITERSLFKNARSKTETDPVHQLKYFQALCKKTNAFNGNKKYILLTNRKPNEETWNIFEKSKELSELNLELYQFKLNFPNRNDFISLLVSDNFDFDLDKAEIYMKNMLFVFGHPDLNEIYNKLQYDYLYKEFGSLRNSEIGLRDLRIWTQDWLSNIPDERINYRTQEQIDYKFTQIKNGFNEE